MTSETTEKKPTIVVPNQHNGGPQDFESKFGFLVVVCTWVYLYFAIIPTLYDGFKDFLWANGSQLAFDLVTRLVTSTIAPSYSAGAPVEFGTPKFYFFCGIGGILSCGITHTAIVPLDLVKCRIQVHTLQLKHF
jgi:hypothetical protein